MSEKPSEGVYATYPLCTIVTPAKAGVWWAQVFAPQESIHRKCDELDTRVKPEYDESTSLSMTEGKDVMNWIASSTRNDETTTIRAFPALRRDRLEVEMRPRSKSGEVQVVRAVINFWCEGLETSGLLRRLCLLAMTRERPNIRTFPALRRDRVEAEIRSRIKSGEV